MLAAMEGAIRASEMPMASQTLRLRRSFGGPVSAVVLPAGPVPAGSLAGPVSLLAAIVSTSQGVRLLMMRPGAARAQDPNYAFPAATLC
jgi:hypothetical protein